MRLAGWLCCLPWLDIAAAVLGFIIQLYVLILVLHSKLVCLLGNRKWDLKPRT